MGVIVNLTKHHPFVSIECGKDADGAHVDLVSYDGCIMWMTGDGGTLEGVIAEWRTEGVDIIDYRCVGRC